MKYFLNVLLIHFTLLLGCNNSKIENPIKEVSVKRVGYKILDRSFLTNVNNDASKVDTSQGFFLQVDLVVANNDSSTITFDSSFIKLVDNNGQIYPVSSKMDAFMANFEQSLYLSRIEPNSKKKGFVIFQVPTTDNYKLQLSNGDWVQKIEVDLKRTE